MITAQPTRKAISGIPVYGYVADTLVALACDIAQQLRIDQDKVVVVCKEPARLLPLVKRRWEEIADGMGTRHRRTFSLKASPKALEVLAAHKVVFATVEQLLRWAPECRVMYVTCPIEKKELYVITTLMHRTGRVVMYTLKD